MVKNPPVNAGDVRNAGFLPGSGRSRLEEGMATHSSLLSWRIPWTDSSDLMYVYSTLERSWRPYTKEDYALSDRMISYLEAFIKTGDPNYEGNEKWLPVNGSGKYMYFDTIKHGMKKIPVFHLIRETLFGKHVGM